MTISCQTESELYDDINRIARFDLEYEPTLIQSGKEKGFIEPLMEYDLYKIDITSFSNLENSILANDKFKKGTYYLNIELDDYLRQNELSITNMHKSMISENIYDKIYHLYLFSDRKSFAICKVNH